MTTRSGGHLGLMVRLAVGIHLEVKCLRLDTKRYLSPQRAVVIAVINCTHIAPLIWDSYFVMTSLTPQLLTVFTLSRDEWVWVEKNGLVSRVAWSVWNPCGHWGSICKGHCRVVAYFKAHRHQRRISIRPELSKRIVIEMYDNWSTHFGMNVKPPSDLETVRCGNAFPELAICEHSHISCLEGLWD